MEKNQLLEAVKEAGLEEYTGQIEKMAEDSIRLTAHPLRGGISPVGASRLGGQPDLPPGTEWPAWKGAPLAFVGQIRLEDARPLDPTGLLPAQGLLSFFYDSRQETYGGSPNDRGGWRVIYSPGTSQGLERAAYPTGLAQGAQFKPAALNFASEITLPYAPKQVFPNLGWYEEEIKRYEDFRFNFPEPGDYRKPHHRMFGYPEQIQDDMQLQAALMSRGIASIQDPRAGAAEKHKSDWLLLLQVDSDETLGMRWGSTGMLYYWIERQALKEMKLDNVWLVLQSE